MNSYNANDARADLNLFKKQQESKRLKEVLNLIKTRASEGLVGVVISSMFLSKDDTYELTRRGFSGEIIEPSLHIRWE